MKVNAKLYFLLVYFITGTFIIAIMLFIVAFNFFKDARVLHPSKVAAAVQESSANLAVQNEQQEKDFDTYKYERASDATPSKNDSSKNTTAESGLPEQKIKVEVINRSTIKSLTEQVRQTLEASGFEVSAGNSETNSAVQTQIIERNDSKAGAKVQKVLKAGKVIKQPDPKSRFDVTVIIGDDFRP